VYVAAWLLMCGDVESNPGPPPYDDDDYYQSDQCDYQTHWSQELWKYVDGLADSVSKVFERLEVFSKQMHEMKADINKSKEEISMALSSQENFTEKLDSLS
jgi:hypothetical protein